MKQHLRNIISDLHKSGYTQDFALYGNELFWMQEKTMVQEHEFRVEHYHRIYSTAGKSDYVVLGILVSDKAAKGILLTSYNYAAKSPLLVFKKLKAFAEGAIRSYTR
jgi:hypothetical protein